MPKHHLRDHDRLQGGRRLSERRAARARVARLKARIAELEAQVATQRTLQSATPTARLNTLLSVSAALLVYGGTHAHLFHPRDLPFVQALADLVAVAVSETLQIERAAALQRDLTRTRSQHAEVQARLNTAQAQLLQSAKLAAVGELAASVAHEINNPLYAARNSLY